MKNSEFNELAVTFGWDWVDDDIRQKAFLKDFIAWAKYRLPTSSHYPIDPKSLACVVSGIENYLNGKAAWPKKSGNKPKRSEMWEAYYLCSFDKEFQNALTTRHKDKKGIYTLVGNKLTKSASAIESLNTKAKTEIQSLSGRQEFSIWFLDSIYNTKNLNRMSFIPYDAKAKKVAC